MTDKQTDLIGLTQNEIIESLKNNIHEIEHSLKEEDRSIAKICLDLNKELFEEKK